MIKIHQVKTRLVNSYVVEYPDKLLVVDVAIKCHRYVLGFIEKELHRSINDIKLVICSHDDPDHIGGIASLASLAQTKVAVPYASQLSWRKLLNDPSGAIVRFITGLREFLSARAYSMYFNTQRDAQAKKKAYYYQKKTMLKTPPKLHIDVRLKHGQLIPGFEDWQVLHTPGHSWDSCCFYHAQTHSLLSGDTLLGSAKKQRLFAPAIYANRKDMLRTLKVLTAFKIQIVYPGHGSIISGDNIIAQAKLQ